MKRPISRRRLFGVIRDGGLNALGNPFQKRLDDFIRTARTRRLDEVLVFGQATLRALTGIDCDNACLQLHPSLSFAPVLYTDFRYVPMVHREAPWLKVCDLKRLNRADKRGRAGARPSPRRIGCEFAMSHARFERLRTECPRAKFVDVTEDLAALRAVKTPEEIEKLRVAERITCEIWNTASAAFRPGMTEREMARLIRKMIIDRADGESFETIVCVGANAAECHHVPDDTVWDGRAGVLVDMGVRLDGYCADLTRNLRPRRPSVAYRAAYELVLKANRAAIAAVKPGLSAGALDRVARRIIADGGFGKCFGHSLGHGVGLEIHEAPTARKGSKTILKPGMLVTIEPGIYLEGNFGVRIEDLVLVTETGCEVLSVAAAK